MSRRLDRTQDVTQADETSADVTLSATPRPATPDEAVPGELRRVVRLAATTLGGPARLVAVTPDRHRLLAAAPSPEPAVPPAVVEAVLAGEGVTTVHGDGHRWAGIGLRMWQRAVPVALVVADPTPTLDLPTLLDDLAALARTVADVAAGAEEADALRELLGTAAHDLRNPLSVLRASLETITTHGQQIAAPQRDRIAELAIRQAERMTTLIDGMLAMHGMEDGQLFEPVDLCALLADVVESGRLIHRLVDLATAGPIPVGPVLVRGIPDALARLVTNLVTNAAIHGGGIVRVGLATDADQAIIAIEDDGPGLPEGTPLDGGARSHGGGGHGLGLVIARRIVDTHRGRITHGPTASGRGTRLEIRLPLAPTPRQVRLP